MQEPRSNAPSRRRIRRVLVVAAVLCALVAAAVAVRHLTKTDPRAARRADFDEAWDDYDAGRFPEARVKFQKYIEVHGPEPRALYMLGISLSRLGRTDEGAAFARQALEKNPGLAEAALFLAATDLERGDLKAAREMAERAIAERPGFTRAHAVLGKVLARTGAPDREPALEQLRFAARSGTDDPEVYLLLTELSGAGADLEDTRKWLKTAIESAEAQLERPDADPATLRWLLARCYYATGEYSRSYDELEKALAAAPGRPQLRLLLGKLQYRREMQGRSHSTFEALSMEQPSPGLLLDIADFYTRVGKPARAERYLETAIERFPGNVAVVSRRVRTLLARDRADAAEAALRRAIDAAPHEPGLVILLAETLLSLPGRSGEAEALLREEAQTTGPTSPAALRLAELLLDKPEDREGLDRAEEIIEVASAVDAEAGPTPTYLDFLRAKLALSKGRFDEADGILRGLLLRVPKDPAAHLLAARLHEATGRRGLQVNELTQAISLTGPTPALLRARATAYLEDGLPSPAVRDAERALELDAGSEATHRLLARAKASVRPPDLPGAIRTLEAAADLPNATIYSRVELARALAAAGELERARQELAKADAERTGPDGKLAVVAALADLTDGIAGTKLCPEAEEILRTFVETWPNHLGGRLLLAARLLEVSRIQEARGLLEETVGRFANSVAARRLLFETCFGDMLGAKADPELAKKLSTEVAGIAPDSVDDLYMRGKLALLEEDPGLAVSLLERAVHQAPDDDRATHFLGLALYESGQVDPAKRLLQKLIDRSPHLLSTRRLLARISFEEGREAMRNGSPEKAAALLLVARKRDPGAPGPSVLLARALFTLGARGDPEALARAEAECRSAVARLSGETSPEARDLLAETYLLLADVCDARDDFAGVEAACEGYLEIHPDELRMRLRLAVARIAAGGVPDAIGPLEELHADHPANAEVLAAYTFALEKLGRLDEALAAVRRTVAAHPDLPHLRVVLAGVLARRGDDEEAVREARAAIELDPDYLPAADALYEVILRSQGPAATARAMHSVAAPSSHKGELSWLEGRALLEADPLDPEAIRLLTEALETGMTSRRHHAECVVTLLGIRAATRNWEKLEALATDFLEWSAADPDFQRGGPFARWAAECRFYLGLSAHDNGRLASAESLYRRAIDLYEYYPSALNNLACILCLEPDRVQEALRLAGRARDFLPGNPEYHDTMAMIFEKAGEPGKALDALVPAEEILAGPRKGPAEEIRRRRLARILIRKASLLVTTRDPDAADAALARAAELNPSCRETDRWKRARQAIDSLR